MNMDVVGKEEDFLDDKDFFYSEEETQSNINYLKKQTIIITIVIQIVWA